MGILCKHALLVFNCMDVTSLPNSYISRRWMKNVRNRVNSEFEENVSGGVGGHESEMVFVNHFMISMYDLAQLSKPHEDARKKLYTVFDTAKDEISDLVQSLSVDDETPCDDIPSDDDIDEVRVRNPLTAKVKGVSNANITRHWDTKGKKGKGKGKAKEKEEITSAKGSKIKGQSSEDVTNTRAMNDIPSQQHPSFIPTHYPFPYPQFPSQFGQNQYFTQYSNQMQGNTNFYSSGHMNLFPYQFGGPHSSQEGNTNLNPIGHMNLFPYPFGGPHSSQEHDNEN